MQGAEKKDGRGQGEGAFIGKADGASPKGSTLSERDDGAQSRRARSLECSKIQTSMPGVWAPPPSPNIIHLPGGGGLPKAVTVCSLAASPMAHLPVYPSISPSPENREEAQHEPASFPAA